MNKTIIVVIVAVIFLLAIGLAWHVYAPTTEMTQPTTSDTQATTTNQAMGAIDYKDATYTIGDASVTLKDGEAETPAAPGSASMITTRYFGNEATTDLNGDGRPDSVFILTQSGGGSGTFYYVVAALNTSHGYIGSNGYLLGDRIAPQTTEISQDPQQDHVVVVNYADRSEGQPMSTSPTVAKSVSLTFDPATMQFVEAVAQDLKNETK